MESQDKVEDFCREYELEHALEHRLLDFISEIGDLSKEVLEITHYGDKEPNIREETELELGDVFFSLCMVANELDVNLEDAMDKAIGKYKKDLEKKKIWK